MSAVVHIVDYGIGNLYSVARAVEKTGAEARLCSDAAGIAAADRLILPGVGAFRDGMAGLTATGLTEAVTAFAESGRPLLGICLGMQMLGDVSQEFGAHRGLGILPGTVMAIPTEGADGTPHKVPFIGWAPLRSARPEGYAGTPLAGLDKEDSVYLVHSYHLLPDNRGDVLATYDYNGVEITAAVARGNVFGCQFHPEKSARCGLQILSRFLSC